MTTITILADSSLPMLQKTFPAPFKLTTYRDASEIPALLKDQEILLCRSTLRVDEALLGAHPSLKIVGTASSGVDHIDEVFLANNRIQLVDAKGSNANAVADYVLACLAYLRTTENVQGTKVGIIGAGEVGGAVFAQLLYVGMQVTSYDPPKAIHDPHYQSATLDELMDCEILCVHANRHSTPPYPSVNLLDEAFLTQLRPQTVIINAARGGIVNEAALIKQQEKLIYCTDVYNNEPHINESIVNLATLCTPHIAGHSIEAKQRAITMLSEKIHALYSLPVSQIQAPQKPHRLEDSNWEERVLSWYNPLHETTQLKTMIHQPLEERFLKLRRAHTHRHDFNINVNRS